MDLSNAILAQTAPPPMSTRAGLDWGLVAESALYAGLAILILVVLLLLAVKMTPFSIKKEIEDDQNVALGIIMGSVILGVCYIIGRTFGG